MQPVEKIWDYCEVVEEQMRWKKAIPMVSLEIENHLIDQVNAYIHEGDTEEVAVDKAILQMGDAEEVGRGLDASYRPKPQWFLLLFSVGLLCLGALLQLSCYFYFAPEDWVYTFRVMPFVLAGIALVGCYFLDFTMLGKYALHCYFATLIVTIAGVLLSNTHNASGVLYLGFGRVMISVPCVTLMYPLVFALMVYHLRGRNMKGFFGSILGLLPMFLVLYFTTSASNIVPFVISATAILCFTIYRGWFGEGRTKQIRMMVATFVVMAAAGIWCCITWAYRWNRLMAFIDPMSEPNGSGFVYRLIRELMSGTQFIGKGVLPSGVETIDQIPMYTDFMLSFFSHQFGWIVFVVVAALFVLFAVVVGKKVLQQTSVLGTVVSLSIFLTFVVQAVIYFVYNLGYGLLAPISLPFVSFGNMAMIVNGALVGFMLSVFRTGEIYSDSVVQTEKMVKKSRISFVDGKLVIDFSGLI